MKKRKKLLLLFMLVFMFLTSFKTPIVSYALDSSTSSSIIDDISSPLDDLKKDPNFNPANYQVDVTDYNIYVIQIAETSSRELYIYTYQPSNTRSHLTATSISMSYKIDDELDYQLYTLKFLNVDSLFCKYVVNDFKVKNDEIRYYDISTIYRPFIDGHDKPLYDFIHNQTDETPCKVGQLWSAKTINNELVYSMIETETITITDKFVGFIRYFDGFDLNIYLAHVGSTDSHFVAFSTDKQIDFLYEAQISYFTQTCLIHTDYSHPNYSFTEFGEKIMHNETIKYNEIVESTSKNWLASTYKWGRIQTRDEFLESDGDVLSDEVKTEIDKKQFVLRFYESAFSFKGTAIQNENSIRVSEVVILRLKFKTAGITYNLGVVDSKVTGPSEPVAFDPGGLDDAGDILKYIFMVLALILLLVIVMPFLPTIINAFKVVVSFIVKIITYPFKVIFGMLEDKGKDKDE